MLKHTFSCFFYQFLREKLRFFFQFLIIHHPPFISPTLPSNSNISRLNNRGYFEVFGFVLSQVDSLFFSSSLDCHWMSVILANLAFFWPPSLLCHWKIRSTCISDGTMTEISQSTGGRLSQKGAKDFSGFPFRPVYQCDLIGFMRLNPNQYFMSCLLDFSIAHGNMIMHRWIFIRVLQVYENKLGTWVCLSSSLRGRRRLI